MFYPDLRKHTSPSAIAMWHTQPSAFIRSYFKGEKSPETASMRGGKDVHALIENEIVTPIYQFTEKEDELRITLGDMGQSKNPDVEVFGKPDSHDPTDTPVFVDYKTGKENKWTREVLATDIKMKVTALLVFYDARSRGHDPEHVTAHLEFIPTQWNPKSKKVEPAGGEHETVSYDYSASELEKFAEFIDKTVSEINKAHEKFQAGSDALVDEEDVKQYAELERQKKEIEAKQDVIKERLETQMELGGINTFSREGIGTFFVTERKTYEYPDDLELQDEDGEIYTRAKADQIVAAKKAAEKRYEQESTPKKVTRSVTFRPAKKK